MYLRTLNRAHNANHNTNHHHERRRRAFDGHTAATDGRWPYPSHRLEALLMGFKTVGPTLGSPSGKAPEIGPF